MQSYPHTFGKHKRKCRCPDSGVSKHRPTANYPSSTALHFCIKFIQVQAFYIYICLYIHMYVCKKAFVQRAACTSITQLLAD